MEPLAILVAIFAFGIEMSDRREERTARAWQLVTVEASGNSGKTQALEYLNSQSYWWLRKWWPYEKERIALAGIDLTPPILKVRWKGIEETKRYVYWLYCPDYVYLAGVNLPDAFLHQATLPCVSFNRANLSGAYLRVAKLNGATFLEADLSRAHLVNADISGAHFSYANLSEADLSGVKAWSASFYKANLHNADLAGGKFESADFREVERFKVRREASSFNDANLSGANLSGAKLSGANLSRAHLRGADLSGADLSVADLSDAQDLTQAQLDSACTRQGQPPQNLPIYKDGTQLVWHGNVCPEK